MATNRTLDELFRSIGVNVDDYSGTDLPSPEEASQESVERMIAESSETVRVLSSRGEIHLKGSGVKANAAPAACIGSLLNEFQCAVDALGASIKGHMSARGAIPSAIRASTTINVVASPQPGSIRLNISPAQRGFDEVFPDGETLFGFEDLGGRPLADVAVEELLGLISKVVAQSPNGEELVESLMDKGPRVASTFKGLMQSLDEGDFDADLKWSEPDREKREACVTKQLAKHAVSVIENARIESKEAVFRGTLITSTSSKKDKIRILLDESGEERTVSLGDIDPMAMSGFHPNEKVVIRVEESVGHHVGGGKTVRFAGLSIEPQPALGF